jgi:hypothetical protein
MAAKPTGRPRTKPFRTIALTLPLDLLERVQTYARQHRQSLAALIRDSLEWRLRAGAPRGPLTNGSGYFRNSLLGDLVTPAHLLDVALPFDVEWPPGGHAPTPGPLTLAETRALFWYCPPFNPARHSLQPLCKHRHEWGTTGQTLKTIKGSSCLACKAESQRRLRKANAAQKHTRQHVTLPALLR